MAIVHAASKVYGCATYTTGWAIRQKTKRRYKNIQEKNLQNLPVEASAPAAEDITPRLVIDSIKPPYTMLLIISNPRTLDAIVASLCSTTPI